MQRPGWLGSREGKRWRGGWRGEEGIQGQGSRLEGSKPQNYLPFTEPQGNVMVPLPSHTQRCLQAFSPHSPAPHRPLQVSRRTSTCTCIYAPPPTHTHTRTQPLYHLNPFASACHAAPPPPPPAASQGSAPPHAPTDLVGSGAHTPGCRPAGSSSRREEENDRGGGGVEGA